MKKTKLAIMLNPDVAKQLLGWDKELPYDETPDYIGTYFSKCTEDVSFLWSNAIGPNPQVTWYTQDYIIKVSESMKAIYAPYINSNGEEKEE